MFKVFIKSLVRLTRIVSVFFVKTSQYLEKKWLVEDEPETEIVIPDDRIRLLKEVGSEGLYLTANDIKLWLNKNSYLGSYIVEHNEWESDSVSIVKEIVKENQVVADVGANFGYYTTLLSRLVGSEGKVLAFEPTAFFRRKLIRNLQENEMDNVEVFDFGLSDKEETLEIKIDDSTASLHMPSTDSFDLKEEIRLVRFDDFIIASGITKLDFIKIDVDGHEPAFIRGALNTLRNLKPAILLEVNHLNYLEAGVTAWEFYELIKEMGYRIFNEHTRLEITNKHDFLKQCGNFGWQGNYHAAFSINILLSIINPFN